MKEEGKHFILGEWTIGMIYFLKKDSNDLAVLLYFKLIKICIKGKSFQTYFIS